MSNVISFKKPVIKTVCRVIEGIPDDWNYLNIELRYMESHDCFYLAGYGGELTMFGSIDQDVGDDVTRMGNYGDVRLSHKDARYLARRYATEDIVNEFFKDKKEN